jgi:mRNA deadenylase 3'-5' endonuclease subunit Ccr4
MASCLNTSSDSFGNNSTGQKNFMQKDQAPTFSILQYNILAGNLGTESHFPYVKKNVLDWNFRRNLIVQNVITKDPTIVCMEELNDYEDYFKPVMFGHGYNSVYSKRPSIHESSWSGVNKFDGCGIFFKSTRFEMLETETLIYNDSHDRIALFLLLKSKDTGDNIIIVSTHLYWNINKIDVQLAELNELHKKLKDVTKKWFSDTSISPPILIAGDFNNVPGSAVYEYMENELSLKSAYRNYTNSSNDKMNQGGKYEPPHTTVNYKRCQTIDYIWHSNNLQPIELLKLPIENELRSENGPDGWQDKVNASLLNKTNNNGIPNSKYGSDHIPLMAQFNCLSSSL